jgi:hypothetical protein
MSWRCSIGLLKQGRSLCFRPLSIQYADYAAWDRQTRTEQSLREHLQFWKAKLQDIPPLLELPADHPRPAHQSFCGATLRGKLSRALCSGLRTIGTAQGATLSMVLLAGLSVLSHRQTGQERFLIGIPSLGRDRVETESLLGFFVNILPIRVDVSGNPSFEQLVQRIRIEVLEAFAHDSVPFERLVQELQIERSASHSPLIQLALAPQPLHERDLQLGALCVERIDIESHRAAFDVTLYVWEDEAGCELCIEYNTDLFLRSTMERFLRQLQSLLEGAALAPQRSVSHAATSVYRRAARATAQVESGGAHSRRAAQLSGAVRGASDRPHRMPSRCWSVVGQGARGAMQSWISGRISWRGSCAAWESDPRCWLRCVQSGVQSPCWESWESSRPEAPMCRSIQTIPGNGWP